MTSLCTRKPLIYFDKHFALFSKLVSQECAEHTKPVIICGFTKLERASHTTEIDVLYTDNIQRICEFSASLVQPVFTAVCNALMLNGNFAFLFAVVAAPAYHTT